MGTEERDWVDVANDLLCKCHLKLKVQRLTECDARVFVALYEAILGEKVPDYIRVQKSQEDDIHNVQSVIDSLALDYLQISLSHITGENVVRGDRDCIRNLLEIFDGLLEYLTEQLSDEEELQNGGINGKVEPLKPQEQDKDEGTSQTSSTHSGIQSSKYSWNGEESESTAELIRLGESARTFTIKQEERQHPPTTSLPTADPQNDPDSGTAQTVPPGQPPSKAVALQPPKQLTRWGVTENPFPSPPTDGNEGDTGSPSKQDGLSTECNGVQINGELHSLPSHSSSEKLDSDLKESKSKDPESKVEVGQKGAEGTRRVLFRTQPDVLLLSLPREQIERQEVPTPNRRAEKPSDDDQPHSSGSSSSGRQRRSRSLKEGVTQVDEDPLSRRSQRNRQAEQELQEMSEKLARRLEELDLLLKRALGETAEETKPPEEDKRSHHSDSVMECRAQEKVSGNRAPRTRSLSPSPVRHSLQNSFTDTTLAHTRHRMTRELQDQQRKTQMVTESYKADLRNMDERQRVELAFERRRAQEAEQEYREAVRKEASHRTKSKPPVRSLHSRPPPPIRPRIQTRKTAPLRVKENNLLQTLLDDLPPQQFSTHTLSRMWKQQLRQVDQLGALNSRHRLVHKLTNEVEEAYRRHELLMEVMHKEQEHNHRLRDFRERIQQQRSVQNKVRDQRQQVARARKYHHDYHVQLRARLLRERTREEKMFRQVFKEGLELQRSHLREQRAYAKEQRKEHDRKHRDEIAAMENYYRDQFSMLAERLAVEREEIQVRKKAQEKALHKMKRELRTKMEREISELQKIIIQNDDEDYFRDLEVERLRRRVQMASFQYSTGSTH